MRWSAPIISAIALSCSVLAQGPNQAPLGGIPTPQTQAPSPFQEKAEALFKQGKRLFNIYLGSNPVDLQARDESDKQAGVVRLTDQNWDTEMAAWDGDWAIIIHGHQLGPAINDPSSTHFMAMHDNATRMAREYIASPPLEKDVDEKVANLKLVKWARFDYITEWESCARWMITRPPWLVFVSDHGKEMRFLGTRSISAEGRKLFSFMSYRNWQTLNTWKPVPFYSKCAETYIKTSHQVSRLTQNIPSWVWFMVVPALTQGFVKYVYFGGDTGSAPARPAGAGAGTRAGGPVPAARKNN